MSASVNTKGLKFVPANAVSKEAKHKLDELMKKKSESLTKLVEDYKSGKLSYQK